MQYRNGQIIVMQPDAFVFKVEDDNSVPIPQQSNELLAILEVGMCWPSVQPAFEIICQALIHQGAPNVDNIDWAICSPVTPLEGALVSDNPPTVYLVRLDQVLGVTDMTIN